jgi:acyl-coenzyme A synthetase/AMP-(fatty) acid ligase
MLDITAMLPDPARAADDVPPWEIDPPERINVASWLPARVAERAFQRALIQPEGYNRLGKRLYSHLTYAQLDALCDAYAHGLRARGVVRGQRVLMLVSQGMELIALTFALFKMGAVPIMIDPGMGREPFLACVQESEPEAMIGIPRAHFAKLVFRSPFKSVARAFITEKKWWSGATALADMADFSAGAFACEDMHRDDLAAILFTSGSTGIPKGVHYTHGIFDGQVRAIGEMYGIEPGEIEVPLFPLFSLFSIALGMSVVIPDMDPTKPAEVNPANVIEAIVDHGATTAFGSPAVWERVAPFCQEKKIKLPTLRRILTAGAPINPAMMEKYDGVLSEGVSFHTPYGATECLPVATISSAEVLGETAQMTRKGKGLCVGKPVNRMQVKILEITDDAIEQMSDARELDAGEIGEICVNGLVATRSYDNKPEHTRKAKIKDPSLGEDAFWHRMGDVGYLDEQGRLWYCGRKAHRVETGEETMFSIQCEAIFNVHPDIFRSALVGVGERGSQVPVILIEGYKDRTPPSKEEVLKIAASHDITRAIKEVHFHSGFPVDRRHNAKIHREELTEWVAKQRG